MKNNYYPFINLPLSYDYDALEPFIDEKTMHLHHDRHLQTYIDNLNAALKDEPRLQELSLEKLIEISGRLPKTKGTEIRNNAGGVFNHRFFFDGMGYSRGGAPGESLGAEIAGRFGGVEKFKAEFKKAALSVFGSGYAWLICTKRGLEIITTQNQNSPVETGAVPILTIDVWEHAYYLKHYNLRADYIDNWMNVINWERAERSFSNCHVGVPRGAGHSRYVEKMCLNEG